MTRKKNKFWNFCFSCMPGAGQMYQGFMKKGLSIMAVFFGLLALIAYIGSDELLFCLPVIWFYGFFDGIHTNSLPDEEFSKLKDEYLFVNAEFDGINWKKFRIPAAILLIFVGGYSLLRSFVDSLVENGIFGWNSPIIYAIENMLPKTIFSIAIICLGVYLIRGKKEELDQKEYGDAMNIKDEENVFMAANSRFWEEETVNESTEENVVVAESTEAYVKEAEEEKA